MDIGITNMADGSGCGGCTLTFPSSIQLFEYTMYTLSRGMSVVVLAGSYGFDGRIMRIGILQHFQMVCGHSHNGSIFREGSILPASATGCLQPGGQATCGGGKETGSRDDGCFTFNVDGGF